RGRGHGRPGRRPPAARPPRPARSWPRLPVQGPQSPLTAVWATPRKISIQTWLCPPRGAVQSLSVSPRRTWPCRVECLTPTDQFHQGGPWNTFFPFFNTTASGAGMCFFPFFIPLPRPRPPLILFVCKTPLSGGGDFRLSLAFNPLPQQLAAALRKSPIPFLPFYFAL